jgi:hypothetical protein
VFESMHDLIDFERRQVNTTLLPCGWARRREWSEAATLIIIRGAAEALELGHAGAPSQASVLVV